MRKTLSRPEAQLVATWLREKGIELPSGWLAVYRLTPAQVAVKFHVTASEVEGAARREPEKAGEK